MIYQQEITLELNSNTAYTTVGAKQGDAYTREIAVHITADGIPWTIPNGVVASYRIRKPDGAAVWNEAIIKDNTVIVTLSEEALSVAGRAYADIVLYTNSGKAQILSTVSFIIIIMSSPNISKAVASSNEFGYIQQVVDDANAVISESEAWATGTRKGVSVLAGNFVSEITSGGGFTYTIDKDIFRQYVGIFPGETNVWTLTYISALAGWELQRENYQPQRVTPNNIGLTIDGIPDINSTITVTISDEDIQWHNNAKYWSDTAKISRDAIENLDVVVEGTLNCDEEAEVNRDIVKVVTIISQPFNYNIKINKDTFCKAINEKIRDYVFYYNGTNWTLDGDEITLETYGITNVPTKPVLGDSIIINYNTHSQLKFKIPRGYTGDVNFMTLAINPEDGLLYMYRPVNLVDKIDFSISEETGFLQVTMETEV